ncbi:MAG: thiol-disulfide oxidoreductase DCC family protein [Chitinophagaceae bacterium]|jgi:predicted DCC family thiol-disulfide oxidoreductase YuxK|nr:thiol-disulfide oxidoreductase DCC family protein [Chitinophagaceae bacterium]
MELNGEEKKHGLIVLFDGVCNLCNSSVQFIIKRDRKHLFRFGSLQGAYGQQVLKQFGLHPSDFNSFILLEDGKLYSKSSGALRMLKHLGGGWKLFYVFILVPAFIRDAVYNFIATNRYKWFGKTESCMLPTAEQRARFLD